MGEALSTQIAREYNGARVFWARKRRLVPLSQLWYPFSEAVLLMVRFCHAYCLLLRYRKLYAGKN